MKTSLYNVAKFLIGWPLSLVALYFVWILIQPQAGNLINNLRSVNLSLLTAGTVSFIIFYFLRSFIWFKLLRELSYQIPFKQATFLWAISELKRYIPGKFWFIIGRAVAFSDKGVSKRDTGTLLIIELEIFVMGALFVSLLSLPFLLKYFLPGFAFAQLLIIVIVALIFGAGLIYIFNQRITKKLPHKALKIVNFVLPKHPPASIAFLIFISTISLIFYGLGYYFTISSVIFLHPQLLPQLIGFFTLSFLIGFLTFLTPAGLGVREGVVTIGLAKILSSSPAAFVSLFGRIILILAELIFIAITIIWSKITSKKFVELEKWISGHKQETILFCLFLLYCIYFTITSFLRYDNFYTGRFDLGNMAQTVWNTSQGRIFEFTNPNATETISRLAFHSDFILILLAPFYYIWENPKILLLIQTIVVAGGAFFVFLLARDILKNKNLALIFSFMYLINPSIERANLYDFHPVTLATFFLLGTYYFYRRKKYLFFLLFAILAAITKEQIWAVIALFGIFIFFFQRKKIFGLTIFAVSSLMFYFLIWHAIPNALGSQHFALDYYSEFGDSPGNILKTIIFSPQKIVEIIFQQSRLSYLNQLFLPVGFLSIFAPLNLLFALPDLLINLLSNNEQLHQIYYQYTSAISPFIFITAIFGLNLLRKKLRLTNAFLVIYLLTFSLIGAYLFGPLPGAKAANLDMFTRPVNDKSLIDNYLSGIPDSFSVSGTNNVGSHLAQRAQIYTVPQGMNEADMVIFLLTNSGSEKAEKEMVEKLKLNNEYYIDLEKDKFIVFRKKGV